MAKKKGVWVPFDILQREDLTLSDKIVIAMVYSLGYEKGCFASTEYMAGLSGIAPRTVVRSIRKAVKMGILGKSEETKFVRNLTFCVTEKDQIGTSEGPKTSEKTDPSYLYNYKTDYKTGDTGPTPALAVKEAWPPAVDTVRSYIREIGASVDATRFVEHYTAVDWCIGSTPIRDWRALVRRWQQNEKPKNNLKTDKINTERKEVSEEWEKLWSL